MQHPILKQIQSYFITGIFILLPLAVTLIVIQFFITKIGAPSNKILFWYLDPSLRESSWIRVLLDIASFLIVIMGITFLGMLSQYFFGKMLVRITETIVSKVPFISTIYKTVKQVVDTFSEQQKSSYQKAVLIEFPRKGSYALGFVTSESKGEIQEKTVETVVNIFLPTTPNPTSGFLLMIPKEEIIYLNMNISDAMKLIISGGGISPSYIKSVEKDATLEKDIKDL